MKRASVDSVFSKLTNGILYTPENIGFKNIDGTGRGIKICIVDSGVPEHLDVNNIKESVNFTNSPDFIDRVGHSTMMAGLITSCKEESIVGLAPDAELYFAKVIDDECGTRFDSIVAAILWAVIKECDIISLPISTEIDSQIVHDAIKKAYGRHICIISSAGNDTSLTYPAKYSEVLSVGCLDQNGTIASFSSNGKINIVGTKIVTTYLNNSFAVVNGTSIATAFAVGICAKILHTNKSAEITYTPEAVFQEMLDSVATK